MRRLLFSLLAMTFVGMFVGCQATHGVCDCGSDMDDHCASATPWISESGTKANGPAPAPDVREKLPNDPKKL